MDRNHKPSYPRVPTLFQMQLEIDPYQDLRNQHEHEPRRERSVNVVRELPPSVCVAEEVAYNR